MFGSFPPSLWLVCASKVYSGLGADIVYGIISLIDSGKARLGETNADDIFQSICVHSLRSVGTLTYRSVAWPVCCCSPVVLEPAPRAELDKGLALGGWGTGVFLFLIYFANNHRLLWSFAMGAFCFGLGLSMPERWLKTRFARPH